MLVAPGGMKRKDEDGEVDEYSPFSNLQKNVVLREARIFHDRELNALRCSEVLTKLLFLIYQGESFTSDEATEVFFAVTKLFQCPESHLRRLVYLMIKELQVETDSSLIVVSCLSKDMTSRMDLFRANSIRVLASIMDASMVQQMERFLKQAIVDRNPFIMSNALAASQRLFDTSPDVVRRWVNEIQEALSNKSKMVQYHSLALLYRLRQHDKQAISKLASSLARGQPHIAHSPMAQVLHIRIITSILQQASAQGVSASSAQAAINAELLRYLIDCLHNQPYIVMFEAARSLCRIDGLTSAQIHPAISILQELLTSGVPGHRFAAVRTLSQLVIKFPVAVSHLVVDLEHLITDPNRSIATLAITTLLKTGVESNVDRLMKSISGFMTEIPDDFKIVLVEAICTLCLKFPQKYPTVLLFLSSALREEGGFKYKRCLVDSMLHIISDIKPSTELGLEHFCEFIEDCEFPELSVRILHVLGDSGPFTSNPAKYIRYIFNRIILETACVRCAAVSALAKLGAACPHLTDNVVVLLKRCLNDNDDEVRDRAVFYVNVLQGDRNRANELINFNHKQLAALGQLESSLRVYLQKPALDEPFSLDKHLVAEDPSLNDGSRDAGAGGSGAAGGVGGGAAGGATGSGGGAAGGAAGGLADNPAIALFQSIPELKALGPVFKSCAPVDLTEAESEYVVSCIKHIFASHVVFQFNVTNNMEGHVLENVTVAMESEDDEWNEDLSIPEPRIAYGADGIAFVAFTRPSSKYSSGSLSCTLNFSIKEANEDDEAAEGTPDEYQLEEIVVAESDFMKPGANLGLIEFKRQWEELGDTVEVVKKYSLGLDSLQSAVDAVMELLGMQACESSATVPDNVRSHAINLTGEFFGGVPILARAGFLLDAKHGVTLKIAVRSINQSLNQLLTNAIR